MNEPDAKHGFAVTDAAPDKERMARAWLAITAGTLGGFMAMLDTSIANSALPVIQGEIGATQTEGTWIGTAYLTTEIIILPLIAWLERLLGMRRLILISASVFTIFSVICGSATTLGWMIFGRLGQGLSGGVLIPTAFTMIAQLLPPEKQPKAVAIVSVPLLVGPVIGPLLGGWLTEYHSWHYAFWLNVPICGVLLVLILVALPSSPPDWRELRQADWFGVGGMILGLGGLTVMLEEGYREQWFDSALIRNLAATAMIGFAMVFYGQRRAAKPVLKLNLLRDRTCLASSMIMLLMGMVMFGLLFCVPQFLILVRGYNSLEAGKVLFASGLVACAMMFVFPLIMKHVDVRVTVLASTLTASLCCYLSTELTAETPGSHFVVTQLLFGIGLTMTGIPLQTLVISRVTPHDAGEINSIITVSRNLGGSVGLASLASFQGERLEFHHWRLHEVVNANDPLMVDWMTATAAGFGGGPEGWAISMRMLDGQVMRDALVMTFSDSFVAMTIFALLMVPLALLLRPFQKGAAASTPMH